MVNKNQGGRHPLHSHSPAMEWIRMLLIPSLFGGGSCLLKAFFIIS